MYEYKSKLAFYQCFIRLFYFFVKQPWTVYTDKTKQLIVALSTRSTRYNNIEDWTGISP